MVLDDNYNKHSGPIEIACKHCRYIKAAICCKHFAAYGRFYLFCWQHHSELCAQTWKTGVEQTDSISMLTDQDLVEVTLSWYVCQSVIVIHNQYYTDISACI